MQVTTDDGVELFAEATGRGPDILFLHEFSGDYRSWEAQVRFLSRRYRCIAYSARGFFPSEVPAERSLYSQQRAVQDALAVLDEFGSERAHLVGLSMGAFTALNLLLDHAGRVASAVVGSCGYGADEDPGAFKREVEEMAHIIRDQGAVHLAELTAESPYRLAFRAKDPRSFAEWKEMLANQDPVGLANTIAGVQGTRPSLRELTRRLPESEVPLLLVVGDEDDPCLEANLSAKRASPMAGLVVLPKTGHTVNLEVPDTFNRLVLDFVTWADSGGWTRRDPRSQPTDGGWMR